MWIDRWHWGQTETLCLSTSRSSQSWHGQHFTIMNLSLAFQVRIWVYTCFAQSWSQDNLELFEWKGWQFYSVATISQYTGPGLDGFTWYLISYWGLIGQQSTFPCSYNLLKIPWSSLGGNLCLRVLWYWPWCGV